MTTTVPPIIGGLGSAVTYLENATPLQFATGATVSDVDSVDFAAGTLTVDLTQNGDAGDRLSIRNQGGAAGQIGATGNQITYGGLLIGTFTGGTSGTAPLVITFTANSTQLAVQTLARNLTFSNVTENPSSHARTLRLQLTDGDGGTSAAVTKVINVTRSNDRPELVGFGDNVSYTESGTPTVVAPNVTVTDPDSANFEGGMLVVTAASNVQSTDLLMIRNEGKGAGQIGVTPANEVTYGGTVIGTISGTAVSLRVSLNASSSVEAVQALLRKITFQNTSLAVSGLPRLITAQLTDGDGGYSLTYTTTVNITAVNDAPVLGDLGSTVTYVENAPPLQFATTATVVDADLVDFAGGTLTVALSQNGEAGDRLSLRNVGTDPGRIGVTGNQITYGGLLIGTFTGGTPGSDPFVITFNANAKQAAVQNVVRSLTFSNVTDKPSSLSRTVRLQLTDGDGGTSAPVTKVINVAPLNDVPVLGGGGDAVFYADNDPPIIVMPGVTATDPDYTNFGSVLISVSDAQSGDVLAIRNEGTGVGQIGIKPGNVITFGGTQIGTFFGSPIDLRVSLNGSPSVEAVQALLRNITCQNTSQTGSESHRVIYARFGDDSLNYSQPHVSLVLVNTVNHAPIIASGQVLTLPENPANGRSVGLVSASDSDSTSPNNTLTYRIVGGNLNNAFTINSETGQITVNNPSAINFEVTPQFTLQIQVEDGGVPSLSATQSVTINVTDVNEAPTILPNQTFFISEGSEFGPVGPGVFVGYLQVADPDASDPPYTLTYQIIGGNTNGAFVILPDSDYGQIQVNLPLDYETTPVYTLLVQVTDGENPALSSTQEVTIRVGDYNDPLTIVNNQTFAVSEGVSNGTAVGTVLASDPDIFDQGQLTYSIESGNTGNAFAIDPGTGQLTVTNSLALSASSQFVLIIRVQDQGLFDAGPDFPFSDTEAVIVTVTDLFNDPPVIPSGQSFSINDNVLVNSVVGTVLANDPDSSSPNNTLTYGITGGNTSNAFAINAQTGQITVLTPSALASNSLFTLQVRVTDGGVPALSATRSVTIHVNSAPVLGGLGPAVTYVENAAPLQFAASVTVFDANLVDFAGGKLTVDLSQNGDADDRPSILNQGKAAGQIGFTGNQITYGGLVIGSFTGGTSGSAPLVITFNANAKQPAVQALARSLTFSNVTDNPSSLPRTVRLQLTDGDGGTSASVTKVINVTAVDDPPLLGGVVSGFNYFENDGPVQFLAGVTVTEADLLDFDGGTLRVEMAFSSGSNGFPDDRLSIRSQGVGVGEIGVAGNQITYGGLLIGTFTGGTSGPTPLVITFNANARQPAVQLLVQSLTFSNVSENPSGLLNRSLQVRLTDGDPGLSPTYTISIHVISVNDAPVLGNLGPTVTYVENGMPLQFASSATAVDLDLVDFDGGTLTVDLPQNGHADDRLGIRNVGVAAGQIGITGNEITYGGFTVGSFTGGTSGSDPLVITFNDFAKQVTVQAVVRSLTFSNVSSNPSPLPRTVRLQLTDGDGGVSAPVTKQINVTAVNSRPVIGDFAGNVSYTENGTSTVLAANATVTDLDFTDFDTGTLAVRVSVNLQPTDLLAIQNEGTAAGQIGVNGSQITYGGTVIGTFSGTYALTVTFNSSSSVAAVQALLRNITFQSTSEAPSVLPRTVTATLTDEDGGTSLLVTTTVNVTAVNDAPILGTLGPAATFVENAIPLQFTTSATVIDLDNVDFADGVLTVDLTQNGSASDRLGIRNVGVGGGQIGITGNQITFGGLLIGTFTGGTSGSDPLVITLNANAKQAAVQTLVRSLTFRNVSNNPSTLPRTVQLQLTDGDGGSAVPVTKQINVTAIN